MVTLLRLDCTYILPRRKKKSRYSAFSVQKIILPLPYVQESNEITAKEAVQCAQKKVPQRILTSFPKEATDARRAKGA